MDDPARVYLTCTGGISWYSAVYTIMLPAMRVRFLTRCDRTNGSMNIAQTNLNARMPYVYFAPLLPLRRMI